MRSMHQWRSSWLSHKVQGRPHGVIFVWKALAKRLARCVIAYGNQMISWSFFWVDSDFQQFRRIPWSFRLIFWDMLIFLVLFWFFDVDIYMIQLQKRFHPSKHIFSFRRTCASNLLVWLRENLERRPPQQQKSLWNLEPNFPLQKCRNIFKSHFASVTINILVTFSLFYVKFSLIFFQTKSFKDI